MTMTAATGFCDATPLGARGSAPPHNRRLICAGLVTETRLHIAAFNSGAGVAVRGRLNAFFAISMNSPSMSMVNFSYGVCLVRNAGVRGVTRTVTPQPMRAAVRMEAGAHA
jgi:hypothetical protein